MPKANTVSFYSFLISLFFQDFLEHVFPQKLSYTFSKSRTIWPRLAWSSWGLRHCLRKRSASCLSSSSKILFNLRTSSEVNFKMIGFIVMPFSRHAKWHEQPSQPSPQIFHRKTSVHHLKRSVEAVYFSRRTEFQDSFSSPRFQHPHRWVSRLYQGFLLVNS